MTNELRHLMIMLMKPASLGNVFGIIDMRNNCIRHNTLWKFLPALNVDLERCTKNTESSKISCIMRLHLKNPKWIVAFAISKHS